MTGVSWRPPPPPPAPDGWASAAPAGRWRGGAGGGRPTGLGVRRPSGWGGGRRRPVKVTDSRGAVAGAGLLPAATGRVADGAGPMKTGPVMLRRSLRKLLFTSGPKLLTLGQILWQYAERAFHELSYVCFGFILAIMGIALDRSKWRSVISPKIAIIFFKFAPFSLEKYWPKVTNIAHPKVHWRAFSLTRLGDSSSYRSWDSREGWNLPPPFPGRVILRPFPVRVLSYNTV